MAFKRLIGIHTSSASSPSSAQQMQTNSDNSNGLEDQEMIDTPDLINGSQQQEEEKEKRGDISHDFENYYYGEDKDINKNETLTIGVSSKIVPNNLLSRNNEATTAPILTAKGDANGNSSSKRRPSSKSSPILSAVHGLNHGHGKGSFSLNQNLGTESITKENENVIANDNNNNGLTSEFLNKSKLGSFSRMITRAKDEILDEGSSNGSSSYGIDSKSASGLIGNSNKANIMNFGKKRSGDMLKTRGDSITNSIIEEDLNSMDNDSNDSNENAIIDNDDEDEYGDNNSHDNEDNMTMLNNYGVIDNTPFFEGLSNSEGIVFNLPYGDGSMKMFGMENFGATCYCNSIIQSLYYTKLFRKLILTIPTEINSNDLTTQRKRRETVTGTKLHAFVTAIKNDKVNPLTGEIIDNKNNKENEHSNGVNYSKSEQAQSKRRMSFFGKRNKGDNNNNDNNENNDNDNGKSNNNSLNDAKNSAASPVIITPEGNVKYGDTVYYKAKSAYPGLQNVRLSIVVPNRNVCVVGVVDDPNATSEQRKRQALAAGPILNIDGPLLNNSNQEMFGALKDIFESMVESTSQIGVVSPSHFVEVLKRENEMFRSMMHQDAHEFYNYLINSVFEQIEKLQKERLNNNKNDELKIKNEIKFTKTLFEGLLTSQTKCLRCERISSRDEKFLDLSIDLENNSSISSCLKQFSANEILCEDNKFYCEYCASLQEATKRMIIKQLPKVLTLHLKRFKYSEKLNRLTKLFDRVSYPLYLRLFNTLDDESTQNFTNSASTSKSGKNTSYPSQKNSENSSYSGDKIYELYAVVVHIGGGPYHGHYVVCIKTEHSGWLLFDDEAVESIDENYVLRFFGDGPGLSTAYILFYQEISEEEYIQRCMLKKLDFSLDGEEEIISPSSYKQGRYQRAQDLKEPAANVGVNIDVAQIPAELVPDGAGNGQGGFLMNHSIKGGKSHSFSTGMNGGGIFSTTLLSKPSSVLDIKKSNSIAGQSRTNHNIKNSNQNDDGFKGIHGESSSLANSTFNDITNDSIILKKNQQQQKQEKPKRAKSISLKSPLGNTFRKTAGGSSASGSAGPGVTASSRKASLSSIEHSKKLLIPSFKMQESSLAVSQRDGSVEAEISSIANVSSDVGNGNKDDILGSSHVNGMLHQQPQQQAESGRRKSIFGFNMKFKK